MVPPTENPPARFEPPLLLRRLASEPPRRAAGDADEAELDALRGELVRELGRLAEPERDAPGER